MNLYFILHDTEMSIPLFSIAILVSKEYSPLPPDFHETYREHPRYVL